MLNFTYHLSWCICKDYGDHVLLPVENKSMKVPYTVYHKTAKEYKLLNFVLLFLDKEQYGKKFTIATLIYWMTTHWVAFHFPVYEQPPSSFLISSFSQSIRRHSAVFSNVLHTSRIQLSMKQTARKKLRSILIHSSMILNSLIGILYSSLVCVQLE